MTESILYPNQKAYKNLEAVAGIMTAMSKHDAEYTLENVWFDFGSEWAWTTICRRGYRECQVLSPKQWKKIVSAKTAEELFDAVLYVMNDDCYND